MFYELLALGRTIDAIMYGAPMAQLKRAIAHKSSVFAKRTAGIQLSQPHVSLRIWQKSLGIG